MPECAIISFRLGSHDGVSATTRNWQKVLEELGFRTFTVAGTGEADHILPGLAAHAPEPPSHEEVERAIARGQLTLVENMNSIPLNLRASRVVLTVLRNRRAIMHHHDPPWQRVQYAHQMDFPMHDLTWQHVVINDFTLRQMKERGIREVRRIYNPFDTNPEPGDRQGTRARLGVAEGEILVAHPVRAIQRKNIMGAIHIAEKLGGTYWLVGPAEDGYGPTLDFILESADCRVIHGHGAGATESGNPESADGEDRLSVADIYAACDVVVYPSFWEGFGNPPVESAIYRKPAIVSDYPAAEELRDLGFQWAYPWETRAIKGFLEEPDFALLEENFQIAERHLSIDAVKPQITQLLKDMGWHLGN